MDFSEVKELIGLINDSDLAYFEIKNEKDYIKIDKSISRDYVNIRENQSVKNLNPIQVLNNTEKLELESNLKEDNLFISNETEEDNEFEYIKSPIVGTYYKAMSPTSDPFVSVNQKVSKGDIVCIVEAMKLMNEIAADFDCEILDILGEDGKIVEYGQPLLKVRRL